MSEYGLKRKSICKVLNKKIKDWLMSIEDKDVRALAKRDVIVTGGSITSMLMGEPINDFDLYFKTKETTEAVAKYYCALFKSLNSYPFEPTVLVRPETNSKGVSEDRVTIFIASSGIAQSSDAEESDENAVEEEYSEGTSDDTTTIPGMSETKSTDAEGQPKPPYRPIFLSQNAITLSNKVQIVIRFYGSPTEIHKNYDFEHCKNVWDHDKQELHINPLSMEAILSKTLIYTGSLYPICSLFRTRKFLQRGWRISAGEILKMSWQISELNLRDINVIKEQLTGCDLNYMRSLIYALEKDLESGEKEVDSSYIVELIDEVFNKYRG